MLALSSGKTRPIATIGVALVIAGGSLLASLPEQRVLGSVHQETFRRVPVVMVVLDEFPIATLMNRRKKIDSDLFPNFAKIQKDSTWFRNATTPSAFTARALPAILAGIYPKNQTRESTKRASLFNLLGGSYDIRSQKDLGYLCPSDACNDRPTPALPRLSKRYGHVFPGARGSEFLHFLSFINRSTDPRLYFMHLVMPHQPWRYLPTGQAYPQTSPIPGEIESVGKGKEWVKNKWLVNQAYQRHLLQTALLDKQIGVLIDRMKKKGIYGRSLFVVTADHGIAYEPGASKRVMTKDTVGHIAAVPLFIKVPHQRKRRISDRPVETVDMVPTVADVLNLSSRPEEIDGISALAKNFPRDRYRETEGIEIGPEGKAKYAVARIKYGMFGTTDGELNLWKTGPGETEKLVGRLVDELNVQPVGTTTVNVEDAETIENTEPDAPLLPALLKGTLNGVDAESKERIAVSLNGRIVATTQTYKESELAQFYAMLPPKWFDEPPNDLELYLIKSVKTETLEPLRQTDALNTLVVD